jgi:hypothetical protein
VLVGLQAVPGKAADLVGTPSGVDEDFDGVAHVVAAVADLVQGGQAFAELGEDLTDASQMFMPRKG